jgi:predicted XRE-type DNA-binding protein
MTGSGVTRLFIVSDWRVTLSPIHLTEKEEEVSTAKKVTASSGNVFAGLGFGHPEEYLLKAALVREIRAIIKRRKLTESKAAAMLGLKQPDVSALVIGRVGKFSIDRLLRCLDRMDYNVDVVVRHKPRRAPSREIAA